MFLKMRRLLFGLTLLASCLVTPTNNRASAIDEGIRIDFASGGRVSVENRFGNISAEVWARSYVLVSASVESSSVSRRSPILIDNRGQELLISVFRAPNEPASIVHLTVKIPSGARLEIVATNGSVRLIGVPAAAFLKSTSGDIESFIPPPFNMVINARAPRGVVRSLIPGAQPSNPQLLQARLGEGANQLDLETQTGQIVIMAAAGSAVGVPTLPGPPVLAGANAESKTSGPPASVNPGDELSEGDVIRVDSQLVTVNMSVIDKSTNRGLSGLRQTDFRLFEDGEEQQITQFESSSAPFDLVLLIDVSGSTKEKVNLMRDAALRFVNAARRADRIGIVTFAGQSKVVSELTADRELLRHRVETLDTSRGDTKLYDATMFTMNRFGGPSRSRRTAIVLMSDGLDGTIPGVSDQIGSQNTYREMLDQMREFDGVVYSLWLNTRYVAISPRDTQPEAFDEAYDRMREMAETGGGVFYEVDRLEDLAGAYERVVADLGTVYTLTYEPTNKSRDGKWRAIRIRVNRANAVARGKRGYYAN